MNILLVEDEPRVAGAIKRSFLAKNYQVVIVRESGQALVYGHRSSFNLIILDLMLPGPYNGLDITRQLRLDNVNTPILILTAKAEVEDRVAGLKAGADDYLIKPFSIKELLARVQVLSRRPRQLIGPILKVDGLELNSDTRSVKRNGQVIKLSNREFKLLNYLMYHQGQIVSKDKIIRHVWDGNTIIMPNTVEVYIGYLRKKIEEPFPNHSKLIKTVFGFGYKIGGDGDV
jgi:two-component system copper resistance phosphate regulon response regulator CusR